MKGKLLVIGNLAKDVIDREEKYGGSAANLAVAASRLGVGVGVMSVLGKDAFSARYRYFLTQNGIDLALTPTVLEQLPVCEVVSRKNMISNSAWDDNGCHPAMDKMVIDKKLVADYGLIHSVSCPPNLARRISDLGINLSYEPGPMLVENSKYFDKSVANSSILIFMNNEEYQVVSTHFEELFPESKDYEKLVALVVTLGRGGAAIYNKCPNGMKCYKIPTPLEREDVVDPTGAGDNFKAGFLAGYIKGRSLDDCTQIGNEMGAACVMQKGGILPKKIVSGIKSKYNL